MENPRKCSCPGCTNYFTWTDPRQVYCSKECKDRASYFRRIRPYKKRPPKGGKVCEREDCKIYKEGLANHCNALVEIPEDTMECSFYKKK